MEKNHAGAALGQTGSSTRNELMAWILVLNLPIRNMYAPDSASMFSTAKTMLAIAARRTERRKEGRKSTGGILSEKLGACKEMVTYGSRHGRPSSAEVAQIRTSEK